MIYERPGDIDFSAADCAAVPLPGRVLLTSPTHFDVEYVINPHMAGHLGDVDGQLAGRQWRTLRSAYETFGFTVSVVEGTEGLADMVFCANQTLPFYRPDDGSKGVVMSRMHAPQRTGEVPHFERYFRQIGYEVLHLPESDVHAFEGMGDALWHPHRYLLWGGYGIRTDRAAYDAVSQALDVPVVAMQLHDEAFYHLDTCFCALDERTVLIYPGAFQNHALRMIHALFDRVVEAPESEARRLLACNAHSPDGRHVLVQEGCTETAGRLREAGFEPVEIDTSEFLKAGGSVYCMKQMFW